MIGAIAEVDFRNQAADRFAEEPELAIAAGEQRAGAVHLLAAQPLDGFDGAAIFHEEGPLRIGGPDSSQGIVNNLRVKRGGREFEGLRLIGMSGIVGAACS